MHNNEDIVEEFLRTEEEERSLEIFISKLDLKTAFDCYIFFKTSLQVEENPISTSKESGLTADQRTLFRYA